MFSFPVDMQDLWMIKSSNFICLYVVVSEQVYSEHRKVDTGHVL